ncbi:hypothetical protein CEB3_c13810 [Peptococcaceae bacterium CEB3]|nr:hypothetical protein CEB3_c13810 [Peptococcaceae bacterium CEB3]
MDTFDVIKSVFVAVNDRGVLLLEDAAREAVEKFPEEVVFSGEIKNVLGVDILVRLAVDAPRPY